MKPFRVTITELEEFVEWLRYELEFKNRRTEIPRESLFNFGDKPFVFLKKSISTREDQDDDQILEIGLLVTIQKQIEEEVEALIYLNASIVKSMYTSSCIIPFNQKTKTKIILLEDVLLKSQNILNIKQKTERCNQD